MGDKSWIDKPTKSTEFLNGIVQFLDFAFSNASINGKILCPCADCGFQRAENRVEVFSHLLQKGFPSKYRTWYMHGEKDEEPNVEPTTRLQEEPPRQYPMHDMLNDIFGVFEEPNPPNDAPDDFIRSPREANNEELDKMKELLREGNQELFEGSTKYTKLSFIVRLYHIKVLCGATDKVMSMIIDLLKDAFEHANLPASFYEAKKMIKGLGLSYDKIHACPSDCMLYWGPDEALEKCKVCGISRWKLDEDEDEVEDVGSDLMNDPEKKKKKKKKKKPAKILRYFPLIPRLRRLYMSSKTAKLLYVIIKVTR